MHRELRALVGQLLWIRTYPAFREAPARSVLRTVRYAWREQFLGGDTLEFEACGGCLFQSPRNNVSSFIAAVFGERDLNIVRFWRRVLPEGSVLLDVGANIGLYTVPASRLVGSRGRVVGFEAHPRIYGFLSSNVARNCHGNVTLENVAVGCGSGEANIVFDARNPGETRVALGEEAGESVPVISLDDYCMRHDLRRVDYIKIDVEGYEARVLRGAQRVLGDNDRILVQTEYEPAHRARYGRPSEMAELLADHGLRPHRIDWTSSAAAPLASLADHVGEIVWSRRDLSRDGRHERES
jgi:FkbM family methyltransferase